MHEGVGLGLVHVTRDCRGEAVTVCPPWHPPPRTPLPLSLAPPATPTTTSRPAPAPRPAQAAAQTLLELRAAGDFSAPNCARYERRWLELYGHDFGMSVAFANLIYRYPIIMDAMASEVKRKGDVFMSKVGGGVGWRGVYSGEGGVSLKGLLRCDGGDAKWLLVVVGVCVCVGGDRRRKHT